MQKQVIGHMACPTCRHEDAEVKEDKNGNAFLFCPNCATQVFTRNPHRDHHMRKNMIPVTVTVTEPAAPAPAAPAAPAASKPAPAAPAPKPITPAKPKPSTSWFQPIIKPAGEKI